MKITQNNPDTALGWHKDYAWIVELPSTKSGLAQFRRIAAYMEHTHGPSFVYDSTMLDQGPGYNPRWRMEHRKARLRLYTTHESDTTLWALL